MSLTPALAQDTRGAVSPAAVVEARRPLFSKSYALVIGIDDYTGGWRTLSKAVADAEAVAAILRDQHGFEVDLQTSKQVDAQSGKPKVFTRDRISRTIEQFFQAFADDSEARAIVWFAGHGASIRTGTAVNGYLVGADAPDPNTASNPIQRREFERRLRENSFFMEQIEVFIRQTAAKHILLVFDSCFAGTIFVDRRGDADAAVPRTIVENAGSQVRLAITSGSAGQAVPDDGNFRDVFLRALAPDSPADTDQDGFLTGNELDRFLRRTLMDVQKRKETPQSGHLRLAAVQRGDFIFQIRADARVPQQTSAIDALHGRFWDFVRAENSDALVERYAKAFPESPHRDAALAQAGKAAPVTGTGPSVPNIPTGPFSERRVVVGTNRKSLDPSDKAGSTVQRSDLSFSTATVTVPAVRERGTIPRPAGLNVFGASVLRQSQDAARHFVLTGRSVVGRDAIAAELKSKSLKEALVFVHGYNTAPLDAMLRAAQFELDIPFEGLTSAFVWPSAASTIAYLADREHASASQQSFREFLQALGEAGAERVHIIAAGLGAEVVRDIASSPPVRLGEVAFTSPDISSTQMDATCDALKAVSRGVTVYLDRGDVAMAVSARVAAGSDRAGTLRPTGPTIGPCADRIDVTGDERTLVLDDLKDLFRGNRDRAARFDVVKAPDNSTYWRRRGQKP